MATLENSSIKKFTQLLRVRGIVQGVGFRPFVWRLAAELGLAGWVKNDSEGVVIEISGQKPKLKLFREQLLDNSPLAARVESIKILKKSNSIQPHNGFRIITSSRNKKTTTLIAPDMMLCPDCLKELFDKNDRRYLYPYINCTNCGPRYSIILDLPYDRPLTTMQNFELCEACAKEYKNPADRRFHAQPVACPDCGPKVFLSNGEKTIAHHHDPIEVAAKALSEGKIVAIKGLGGYHLAVDAKNELAIKRLRKKKHRKAKAFAIMTKDIRSIELYVDLWGKARAYLNSPARPIVLLPKSKTSLPKTLAPDSSELGVMLPYTPLQYLLFAAGAPPLLVMTSANYPSEAIIYKDNQVKKYSDLADLWLMGTRPIARRVDDSVLRIVNNITILRRARGYAPEPVASHKIFEGSPILALGAGLKNSITLAYKGYAIVSQHLGNLANLESFEAFIQTAQELCEIYNINLSDVQIVHDKHPDYPSTQYAQEFSNTLSIQHHKAHIASVLAEKQSFDKAVLGFSFDGTGLGDDGNIWGGEIFFGSLQLGFKRIGHLAYAALPGAEAAIKYPALAAVGFLNGIDCDLSQYLPEKSIKVGQSLIRSGLNTPKTSSMGRLFDAVSAILGFHEKTDYEGQAAIILETFALKSDDNAYYPLEYTKTWDYNPLLSVIIKDINTQVSKAVIAKRFHNSIAQAVVLASQKLKKTWGTKTIVLSGGVWQNRLLLSTTLRLLTESGFEVCFNQKVPLGDGGISLGQAALVAAQRK